MLAARLERLKDRQDQGVLDTFAKLRSADGEISLAHAQVERLVEVHCVEWREVKIKFVAVHRRIKTELAEGVFFDGLLKLNKRLCTQQLHGLCHEVPETISSCHGRFRTMSVSDVNGLGKIMKVMIDILKELSKQRITG